VLLLCVIGGFTKMDKVYFLWLQKIASLSDKFNAKVYDKIKQCINQKLLLAKARNNFLCNLLKYI